MEEIVIGTTDRTILVFIPDPASTTGAGKTGLVAADLTVTYTRVETDNDVVHTDVTGSLNDLASLTAAHNDWGVLEVSPTLSKGLYRFDLADALFASGAWYAVVQVTITTGTAAATPKAFQLVDTPTTPPTAAAVADAVWDESLAGHLTAGSTGEALDNAASAGTPPTAAAIADAVWDETLSGHLGAGSTGEALDNAGSGAGDGSGFTAIPWNPAWDAEVQSEVTDALNAMFAAARAEPGQGNPAANATALVKLDYCYKFLRNKITQSATESKVFADDGTTVDHKAPITKTSTLFTRGKFVTGP